ncbi:hypothetical protein BOW92_gp077 [Synechococcus phage S-WAM1]|uniref:Uncharacterized protein n=1 Tax=Synechococcus phage S-WAM1 TaxID=1815521 RepID=A0A1D8KSI7_9CAUD|nr:hypothetical protein BOW92_gp077 [Synechococcus phage S-WAM1]AOV61640.1 hypothetical protein P090810_167 [Synechococcus phage S-WAM1]
MIMRCVNEGQEGPTRRLQAAVEKIIDIIESHEVVVEGYAGFPIEKALIDKNKSAFKDDRNIGRVITVGGNSMVITGKKSDGRYSVVGKKGEKTAKHPEDIGMNMQREHIDIEDLHQQMVEKYKGLDGKACWKGYKIGTPKTKKKGDKTVDNCVKEATAMAKRGHDETAIRNKIAKSTGGGKSADRATALADKPTYGNDKSAKQRSDLARKQRTDFRKTTSSSPGLHGYGHKSDDPKVKAKQAARGAQRGALTPNEKKSLNREEFEVFVQDIISDENFDTFTFEELHDICVEALMELDGEVLTEALEMIDDIDLLVERMDPKEIQRRRDQAKDRLSTGAAMKSAASKAKPAERDAGAEARQRLQSKSSDSSGSGRGEKLKAALKSAGKTVAKGAGYAAGAAGRAAKSAASNFKQGYERGSKGSNPGGTPKGGVESRPASSSSGGSSSGGGDANRVRLRDRIKSGIKKVVGGAARSISRGARNVARRMGEETTYSWRAELGISE